ncbi:peptidase M23-like protein [Actinocorallia herbida]|uniref:Peptidase M23-like protein n=1 Tax=Actinocorallia herbida TaxID=58109 RepID=A0A3N1CU84_9ACTN|nr:peptidase inhibitor family I36 protein [Actinocorallia herbida]ROO84872.1 peptidase M23-like protein [Actinocorallia herbida]
MKILHKLLSMTTAVLAIGAGIVATAAPASAAARNGVCEDGEFCYYYNSGNAGSISDFTSSLGNYGTTQPDCYEFKGAGAGQGLCIKNEAASVWNRSDETVVVYFNSNYQGSSQSFGPGAKTNLNATLKNNNASHQFGATSTSLSYGLYKAGGGGISCPFDGYTSTPGRHEGIDFTRSIGSDVHALISGTVTRVTAGVNGGALSTIAVYNASLDKTIIYLHSAPRVSVGDAISKGEIIADEAYRGISSSGAAHTHVEMRLGRQTAASVSVGDPVLDNPNPHSFWRSQGYSIA